MNINPDTVSFPSHFSDLKREIAANYPDFEARISKAWKEVIEELATATTNTQQGGPDYIPQVDFNDLDHLTVAKINKIKRRGCVVIRDIVDDRKAVAWRESLRELVRVNPEVDGFPIDNKQLFHLYWTQAQVQARADPNLLKANIWLNNLYQDKSGKKLEDVDLSVPLIYADRFRIRKPGFSLDIFPPHVDGGTIERWEDPALRKCFEDILAGNWRQHDPYDLKGRIEARSSMYGRPNQSTVFRSFQGWLSLSETGPTEGTLGLFPDVLLSNTYIILRPFFKSLVPADSPDVLDPKNWSVDLDSPDFPGLIPIDGSFAGPCPTPFLHPHLLLEKTMTPVPKVYPGDAVFWHCDMIHSVEKEHLGKEDSAVMYIPAVPYTVQNFDYVERQRECFLQGQRPPDFPKGRSEAAVIGVGHERDIGSNLGRRAMGFPVAESPA